MQDKILLNVARYSFFASMLSWLALGLPCDLKKINAKMKNMINTITLLVTPFHEGTAKKKPGWLHAQRQTKRGLYSFSWILQSRDE